jgi:hypothetical protein
MEAQRRRRYMMFGGAIAAVILLVVALSVVQLLGDDDGDVATDDFPPVQAAQVDYDHIPHTAYFMGDPDAPVHLVEWSDYQ